MLESRRTAVGSGTVAGALREQTRWPCHKVCWSTYLPDEQLVKVAVVEDIADVDVRIRIRESR